MGRTRTLPALALLATALAGCVVGPDYDGPPPVAQDAAASGRFVRAGAQASLVPPEPQWWTALGDPELDRLEDRALQGAPDLAVAVARLREARAGLRNERANRLPNTGTAALYLRTRGAIGDLTGGAAAAEASGEPNPSAAAQDSVIQFYDAGFDATWEPDLFGGRARAVEGAKAAAEAADYNREDAEVSLTADVAQAYLQLRLSQARLALSRRTAELEGRLLAFTQTRRAGGTATDLDVERLNDQLETTRTAQIPLQADQAGALDRLAVLAGASPGTLDGELAAPSPVPLPPAAVAVGDPAALLRRRPDVRAAERRIEQQTAIIGERTADLFPKVTLLGDIGFGSTDLGGLLTSSSFTYAVAPVLQWSPFDFGRTRARIAQARASRDEAVADYRRTVLGALGDAETALARYGRQRENLAGLYRVQASAERASRLTGLRLQGGTATTLDVLDAERSRVEAETNVTDARAQLTQDFVSLQKSLGLGWSAQASSR